MSEAVDRDVFAHLADDLAEEHPEAPWKLLIVWCCTLFSCGTLGHITFKASQKRNEKLFVI